MSDKAVNGETGGSMVQTRRALFSSSTKLRSAELHALADKVASHDTHEAHNAFLLGILHDTYALYVDDKSRRAAERCLATIASSPAAEMSLPPFIAAIEKETLSTSIAPGNAFVIVRWCGLLQQHAAKSQTKWDSWGKKTIIPHANALSTLLAAKPKTSTAASALRATRAGLRSLARSDFVTVALGDAISLLCTKSAAPTPRFSPLLGVIASVCLDNSRSKAVIEARKSELIAFYVREHLGSRSLLPDYIATGLHAFFASYIGMDELKNDLVPAMEKSLLRAPEIVLNDLIAPIIAALPAEIDLSEMLLNKLLKPLLSNVKSSNVVVRDGALRTFKTIALHCQMEGIVEKVADEIFAPLKAGKLTAPEHKCIHASMLSAISSHAVIASKLSAPLGAVAIKEANEMAAAAEIEAFARYSALLLEKAQKLDQGVVDTWSKGLAEKRLPLRRIWALNWAHLVWSLNSSSMSNENVADFVDSGIAKMIEIFTEVTSNTATAAQSAQAVLACATAAICLDRVPKMLPLNASSLIKKASIVDRTLTVDPKPSFLLNPKIYTKLTTEDEYLWFQRALHATFPRLTVSDLTTTTAWTQAQIFSISVSSAHPRVRKESEAAVQVLFAQDGQKLSSVLIDGFWQWCEDLKLETKESTAISAKQPLRGLLRAIQVLCAAAKSSRSPQVDQFVLNELMIRLLVICRPQLIPQVSWIELSLRMGVDPGQLVGQHPDRCLAEIKKVTEHSVWKGLADFQEAAYAATAELAFVSPEIMTPLIVEQISYDLDPQQFADIGPTEAAIYKTPEGTPFVDVLAGPNANQQISKNSKDYNTLKWEEDLRKQLASKRGETRKLKPEEQAKVNAQLKIESEIRNKMSKIDARLRRGIGVIGALATGPPTEAEEWFGSSVRLLLGAIESGAALIVGDAASLAYLSCAERIASRLGSLRQFVGIATLRAAGVEVLPEQFLVEPVGDLVTRVLYRLRFLGEQRPFDAITLSYVFALVFLVLDNGGIDRKSQEDADEQIVLAIEFLSFHTETCSATSLPRERALASLVASMGRFSQHFKLVKDCFADLCRSVAPNMNEGETDTVVRGAIAEDPSVRTAVLQAISAEMELSGRPFYEEIWLACHDDIEENIEIAREIWEENELKLDGHSGEQMIKFLDSKDSQQRQAAARAIASYLKAFPQEFVNILSMVQGKYIDTAKPRKPELDKYGMPMKKDLSDPWESRHGVALAIKEMAEIFPSDELMPFMNFMIESGPLGDKHTSVRDSMLEAATAVVTTRGHLQVESLMKLCESTLESPGQNTTAQDLINEAVVILYGALARHLPLGDDRVPKVVQRLLLTLSTPSESVQYAVAQCLPALVRASSNEQALQYLQQAIDETLHGKKYAARRGGAYGIAGIIKGRGISALKQGRVLSSLRGATENKKDPNERQGAFLAYELLSLLLGRVFEPYVIQIVPQLLAGFGDTSADVREACLDAAKNCFASLSSFGVKQVLPMLLDGLEDQQWRSKKGASDSLGAMAYLDPQQLAVSLPEIIPPLTDVLNDSHKEVRASANRSLQRFGEVISNPEVKSQVNILLKALSDPTKYTDDALDALIKVNFIHYLDAPSLALVVRILERGLGERSTTKRKAAQIIGSLAHLTERKDLIAHLPILVAGLRVAIVDPVPTTRATASKALGSLVEKLGEDALPDLIPSLMQTLKSDTGAGDRLGSAQALSEVLAGLGTARLEETLPTILQNVGSNKASVREGFMSLFIFLPACFGNSFATYLARVIPPILAGLADDVEAIRETSLRAGRLLVKNFASRSVDLLLPELERGLADDSHRIRLSSVELVGDLLFNLTGISGKADAEDVEENANEAGQSLLEVLGEERRNKVLSALYICRCDTSGLVRTSAMSVWKALVATPRTLRELVPTLTQLLIRRLASSNMEQKVIAGNALGELIRKAGEGVLASLLPTLEEGLQTSTDTDARQGICIALRELITSAAPDSLEDYEKTLISVVRTALVDPDDEVREAAAEAFDSLQRIFGKRAIEQVLPHLLSLLRSEDSADNALAALLTLLTETTRSNAILPNLLPTLLTSPISAFNARALASLAEVASSSMTRKLPNILNALMDNIVACKDEELQRELDSAFDTILLSVDEFDGLNTMMSVMLTLVKHDDHHRRAAADSHMANFFQVADIDFSRYYPDLIRVLLIAFDDSDPVTVKAAWTALNALTQRLRKEEMESLVVSTRQALLQVGVPGHDLPGFSLPKGINAVLPIFLQGLMNGSTEQRTQAALALSDLIDRTAPEGLKPFVTHITGPLIRVVSERSTDLKSAILLTLNHLLEKIPTFLKPFLPQLQRTFAKSLADPSSEVLRSRAAKALGTLITMTPRIDPLIAELVTGSKTTDAGVRNAMLKALYEVVSKAGSNMSEVSRNSILGLIDSDTSSEDTGLAITYSKLLGALVKVLPEDIATTLIKSRVLTSPPTAASVLNLNAVLVESPTNLTGSLNDATRANIVQGINNSHLAISGTAVLAAGKYLLGETSPKSYEQTLPIFEALGHIMQPGQAIDPRRLALVVVRTVSRIDNDLVRPHLALLVPPIFASVRDPVIPIKLSAEAAFLAVFSVVDEESTVFDRYMSGPGAALQAGPKRSMQEYFKRIALRLSSQARERREAEGGQGGLGLSSDEVEDEKEIWSIGSMETKDVFSDE